MRAVRRTLAADGAALSDRPGPASFRENQREL